MSLPMPPPLPPKPTSANAQLALPPALNTTSYTDITRTAIRVLAASDFKSHQEFPVWKIAIASMHAEGFTRDKFPNAASYLAESLRRTSSLMKLKALPLPPKLPAKSTLPLPSALPLPPLPLPPKSLPLPP